MSELKINENLFLGSQELNRLERFLRDDGHRKYFEASVDKFGIPNNPTIDPAFDNLRIVGGSSPVDVSIQAGFAIDSNFDILRTIAQADILTMAPDSQLRFILAEYTTTNIEEGTLDIDANGDIAGTLTRFTEVLRGQPNFPSRIRFPNSILNTGEYELVNVNSDTDATLTGSLVTETDQEYIVIGTFTPDKPIPAPNKDIFTYDSITFTLEASDTSVAGTKFLLATASSNGITLTLNDARTDFFETKASQELIGGNIAKKDEDNIFSQMNTWNTGATTSIPNTVVEADKKIVLAGDGNTYLCTGNNPDVNFMSIVPAGTEITLVFSSGSSTECIFNHNAGAVPAGFAPFLFVGAISPTIDTRANGTAVFKKEFSGFIYQGSSDVATLINNNIFRATQTWSKGSITEVSSPLGLIPLPADGNSFDAIVNWSNAIYMEDKPVGTRITIKVEAGLSTVTFVNMGLFAPAGYIPFFLLDSRVFSAETYIYFERGDVLGTAAWIITGTSDTLERIETVEESVSAINSGWLSYSEGTANVRPSQGSGVVLVLEPNLLVAGFIVGRGTYKVIGKTLHINGQVAFKVTSTTGGSEDVIITLPASMTGVGLGAAPIIAVEGTNTIFGKIVGVGGATVLKFAPLPTNDQWVAARNYDYQFHVTMEIQ